MDPLTLVILVAVLFVAAAVVGSLTLVRGRRRKPSLPPLDVESTPDLPSGEVRVLPPDAVPTDAEPAEAPGAELEKPEPAAGRLARLRGRLGRSQSSLGRGLLSMLSRDTLDEGTWEEVEDTLLTADVGVGPTQELVDRLRTRVKELPERTPDGVRRLVRDELLALVGPDLDRSLTTTAEGRPAVVLVVGVNGTGKTTTVGKLARVLVADGRTVLLAAADTFRAAAADQLQTWGSGSVRPSYAGRRPATRPASRSTRSGRAQPAATTSWWWTRPDGCRTRSA